jgi:NADH dehydrogenase
MTGCIVVFGGTGFIGRHLLALLLQGGAAVRLAMRDPSRVKVPAGSANVPEITQSDILDDISIGSAITGAEAVFNFVGILTETTRQTYRASHVEGARRVALAVKNHDVTRPTPPGIRVRTTAVRRIQQPPASPLGADPDDGNGLW